MSSPSKGPGLPDDTKALMARMHEAARLLNRHGARWARYFTQLDTDDVATQRDTKTHLDKRLKASTEGPQVITVQGRGGQAGRAYLIMPMETMVETLEATAQTEVFVPITATMREIGEGVDLPALTPRGTGRRRRSVPAPLPHPVSGT